jgi:hypothetical protein
VADLLAEQEAYQLAQVIHAILAANSVPAVDAVAHSFGGLAIRAYLEDRAHAGSSTLKYRGDIRNVVTIDTPHAGASLTSLAPVDPFLLGICRSLESAQITQMVPANGFIPALNAAPIPPGVFLTAIASREPLSCPLVCPGDDVVEYSSEDITSLAEYGCGNPNANTETVDNPFGPSVPFPLHMFVQNQPATARLVDHALSQSNRKRLACVALQSGVPKIVDLPANSGPAVVDISLVFDPPRSSGGAGGTGITTREGTCSLDVVALSDKGVELVREAVPAEGFQTVTLGFLPADGWRLELVSTCATTLSVTIGFRDEGGGTRRRPHGLPFR